MPKSILVVDDDPSIARMYSTALGQLGDVTVASSGTEAVAILSVRAFDAIILDIRMPGLGGLDVLDRCFPNGHQGSAVFVVTADQTDEVRSAAMKRGAIFQFTKPVPLKMLVEQVRAQLERRRSGKP